jgi:hypothetical protein
VTATVHKFPVLRKLSPNELLERLALEPLDSVMVMSKHNDGGMSVWYSNITALDAIKVMSIIKQEIINESIMYEVEND